MYLTDYFSGRMGSTGRASPKKKKSPYEIQMAHWRRQRRELEILMNANFGTSDFSLTLEWGKEDEKPGDKEAMQKEMQNFIKRLRRWYKAGHTVYRWEEVKDKRGKPIRSPDGSIRRKRVPDVVFSPLPEPRYIYTMEIGPRGSRHVHMVLSDVDLREITACWQIGVPHGVVHGTALYADGDYTELADYYAKYSEPKKPGKPEETSEDSDTGKEEEGKEPEGEKLGKRWYASQNLYRPEPIVRRIKEKTFSEDPPEVEGYHIDKGSIVGGMDPCRNGWAFRECTYIRDDKESWKPPREKPRKRKRRKACRAS